MLRAVAVNRILGRVVPGNGGNTEISLSTVYSLPRLSLLVVVAQDHDDVCDGLVVGGAHDIAGWQAERVGNLVAELMTTSESDLISTLDFGLLNVAAFPLPA